MITNGHNPNYYSQKFIELLFESMPQVKVNDITPFSFTYAEWEAQLSQIPDTAYYGTISKGGDYVTEDGDAGTAINLMFRGNTAIVIPAGCYSMQNVLFDTINLVHGSASVQFTGWRITFNNVPQSIVIDPPPVLDPPFYDRFYLRSSLLADGMLIAAVDHTYPIPVSRTIICDLASVYQNLYVLGDGNPDLAFPIAPFPTVIADFSFDGYAIKTTTPTASNTGSLLSFDLPFTFNLNFVFKSLELHDFKERFALVNTHLLTGERDGDYYNFSPVPQTITQTETETGYKLDFEDYIYGEEIWMHLETLFSGVNGNQTVHFYFLIGTTH